VFFWGAAGEAAQGRAHVKTRTEAFRDCIQSRNIPQCHTIVKQNNFERWERNVRALRSLTTLETGSTLKLSTRLGQASTGAPALQTE